MSDHTWVQENMAAYSIGGLSGEERERVERHTAGCKDCALALAELRDFDAGMTDLFAEAQPEVGWENRLLDRLRTAPRMRVRWPRVLRYVAAAAAVLMLGTVGALVQGMGLMDDLMFPGQTKPAAARLAAKGTPGGTGETIEVLVAKRNLNVGELIKRPEDVFVVKHMSRKSLATGENAFLLAADDLNELKGKTLTRDMAAGDALQAHDINADSSLAAKLPEGYRAVGIQVNASAIAGGVANLPLSDVDVMWTVRRGDDKTSFSKVLLENVKVLAADSTRARAEGDNAMPANTVTLALKPEDVAKLELAKHSGTMTLVLRRQGEKRLEHLPQVTMETNLSGERAEANRKRDGSNPAEPPIVQMEIPKLPPDMAKGSKEERAKAEKILEQMEKHKDPDGRKFAEKYLDKREEKSGGKAADAAKIGDLKDLSEYFEGRKSEAAYKTYQPGREGFDQTKEVKDLVDRFQKERDAIRIHLEDAVTAKAKVTTADEATALYKNLKLDDKTFLDKAQKDLMDGLAKDKSKKDDQTAWLEGKGKHPATGEKGDPKSEGPAPEPKKPGEAKVPGYDVPPKSKESKEGEVKPGGDAKGGDPKGGEQGQSKADKGEKQDGGKKGPGTDNDKKEPDDAKNPPSKVKPTKKQDPDSEPAPAKRKIIRSGEIDFEVDSFDAGVEDITRLIAGDAKRKIPGIKGAFVATVNSDRLPNGKVRGSVVVRTPPDDLDQFVLDLRRELTKTGELKSLRIGSQDVTKVYYDLESRLKGARTMEDRFINIIKSGKGEIKDLIVAERELGVWRMKIEEMEGEIRYYANQVAYSTLTINLTEKEIRSPSAMVISEQVKMKLEVDDVVKSHTAAEAAVREVKGRVTRSERKMHGGDKADAFIHFEVSPDKAADIQARLEKIGHIIDRTSERVQQPVGGTGRLVDGKTRSDDVQFQVTLYDVANIKPREVFNLSLAVGDVPVEFKKLQEEVTKLKGQVRASHLNEPDKNNITAQFDFDVLATSRVAVDKLLAGLGDQLTRGTTRAAPGETATDRRVGYRIVLRNMAAIPPRETFAINAITADIVVAYDLLQEVVGNVKGSVRVAQMNENDKVSRSAQLDFDIPAADREAVEKVLKDMDILSRTSSRVAQGEIASDKKVGYRLLLRNLAGVPARQTFAIQAVSADINGSFQLLQDIVATAKGQVRVGQINEPDKLNITAKLEFDIPASARDAVEKALKDLDVMTRGVLRVPQNETATDKKVAYRLDIFNLASVKPRETYLIDAISTDVVASHRQLQDMLAKMKATVRQAKLNEQDKVSVSAVFDFDVPSAERENIEKVLNDMEVLLRSGSRAGETETASDKKVGYRLLLRNLAGVKPRETLLVDAISPDVVASHRELQEIVAKARGTVRVAKLNEHDKLSVSAVFDFDVPSADKDAVDKILSGMETLTRSVSRAAEGETVTDKNYGYRLLLRNLAVVKPRESIDVKAVSADPAAGVEALYNVVKAKGQVSVRQTKGEKANIVGELRFTVPSSERDAVEGALNAKGLDITSRGTEYVAQGETATDKKVGYHIEIKTLASVKPRESFDLKVVSLDVPETFRKLQAAVTKASGQVRLSELHDRGKLNSSADLSFELPSGDPSVEALLNELKAKNEIDVQSRNVNRVPAEENASDRKFGYIIKLIAADTIKPRERISLEIDVDNAEDADALIVDMARSSGGLVKRDDFIQDPSGKKSADVVIDAKIGSKEELIRKFLTLGKLRTKGAVQFLDVPDSKLSIARFEIKLHGPAPIVSSEDALWPKIRASLATSFLILSWSLAWILIGVCVVLPWALMIWAGYRLSRKWWKKPAPAAA